MKLRKRPIISKLITVDVPASKSLSNRLLLLKNLYDLPITLSSLSEANDTTILLKLLTLPADNLQVFDVEDAGTVCRFMTAYLASTPSDCIITGSERMQQRPIKDLVDMLKLLGADISYIGNEGFLPLRIKGKHLEGGVKLDPDSNLSSQFYSAIAMIAPTFDSGLNLELPRNMVSKSYFDMTLLAMKMVGLQWKQKGVNSYEFEKSNSITEELAITIERDWSGASFFVFLPIILKELTVYIPGLALHSLQGDAEFIANLAPMLGIEIVQQEFGLLFKSIGGIHITEIDFSLAPDLSLNLLMVLALSKKKISVKGLQTLFLKESDRVAVLISVFESIGVNFSEIEQGIWLLDAHGLKIPSYMPTFATFNDHRVAMAVSYLALKTPIEIQFPEVVIKSFPDFWNQVKKTIFDLEQ